MVGVRAPERLELGALHAWLRTLESAVERGEGVRAPLDAPPGILAAALHEGRAGLREAVVARLAVSAAVAGVSRLEVHLEHPTLVEALLGVLHAHPAHITALTLTFGPRTSLGGLLGRALREMRALTTLSLTPSASDEDLVALAHAAPPLETLDVAYCSAVTDKGVRALLGVADGAPSMKEVLTGRVGADAAPASTLTAVNLWGTEVTTRGCALLLAACPALASLTCRWTGEALDLMVRTGRTDALALSQLLLASEAAFPPLKEVSQVCPRLGALVARRPPEPVSVRDVLAALPSLTALTLLQFSPESPQWLSEEAAPALTYLHLSLLTSLEVDLRALALTYPSLTHLILEGVILTLPHPPPPEEGPPPSKLASLRLVTPPTQMHVIAPSVVVWALLWAKGAASVDLGSCKHFTDRHLAEALEKGALTQVEDLRLSGAGQVTDAGIDDLVLTCPHLRRLALKMLPKERLAELESLKVKIREENLDLELITYGWKF